MRSRRRFVTLTAAVTGLLLLAAACSDTNRLPTAQIENTVDTVSLFALSGTAVGTPSGYALLGKQRVRVDQSAALDLVFDFDAAGRPALFPTGAIHLGTASGIRQASLPFDSIKVALTDAYVLDQPYVVDTGTVVFVQSRPTTCLFGAVASLYAKLRVLAVNTTLRRLDFQILANQNCGYLGLQPGLPTR